MSKAVRCYTLMRSDASQAEMSVAFEEGRISDQDLYRDAVLVLQGVDGRYIRFLDPASEAEKARRDKRGYPIHVLEQQDVDQSALEGALYIVEEPDGVSARFLP